MRGFRGPSIGGFNKKTGKFFGGSVEPGKGRSN